MTDDPTVIRTKTLRIPVGTLGINLIPAFGGGLIIRFTGHGGGFLGDAVNAPAGVTFNPDGTLTFPLPYDFPED